MDEEGWEASELSLFLPGKRRNADFQAAPFCVLLQFTISARMESSRSSWRRQPVTRTSAASPSACRRCTATREEDVERRNSLGVDNKDPSDPGDGVRASLCRLIIHSHGRTWLLCRSLGDGAVTGGGANSGRGCRTVLEKGAAEAEMPLLTRGDPAVTAPPRALGLQARYPHH